MLYADEDSAVSDLSAKIKDGNIKTLRIIYFAMAMGVFSFFVVCVILFFKNKAEYEQVQEMMEVSFNTLYYLGIFCFIIYSLLLLNPKFLFNQTFNENKSRLLNNKELDIQNAVQLVQSFRMIKLGMLEGAAFFGLVVLLYSILQLKIYPFPLFWIAGTPAIIMLVYVIITFPKKENIAKDIYRRIIVRLDNQQFQ